ncbi:hypothetical protein [Providencia rettgeri]|uniref:hypothetical protein n=1 Tax=Providencia rettgeri TaxID=587 RepID=UPI000F77A4B3|nr:hypothetical protein [Providencia rettgeri]MBV2190969.1 hypothetical protein [Providencia rettgeri]
MSQVTRVSHHCAVYRGFTIITLPRKKQTPITRYHVWHLGESFGKFDAMAEATKYIDGLWRMKGGK